MAGDCLHGVDGEVSAQVRNGVGSTSTRSVAEQPVGVEPVPLCELTPVTVYRGGAVNKNSVQVEKERLDVHHRHATKC